MRLKKTIQLGKIILQIDKDDQIAGWIHPFQITVTAIVYTVHHRRAVIEIIISKILTRLGSLIKIVICLRRKDQTLRTMLRLILLPAPVKHILVMCDFYHLCLREPRKDLLRSRMLSHSLLHINMGKSMVITTCSATHRAISFPLSYPYMAAIPVHNNYGSKSLH